MCKLYMYRVNIYYTEESTTPDDCVKFHYRDLALMYAKGMKKNPLVTKVTIWDVINDNFLQQWEEE